MLTRSTVAPPAEGAGDGWYVQITRVTVTDIRPSLLVAGKETASGGVADDGAETLAPAGWPPQEAMATDSTTAQRIRASAVWARRRVNGVRRPHRRNAKDQRDRRFPSPSRHRTGWWVDRRLADGERPESAITGRAELETKPGKLGTALSSGQTEKRSPAGPPAGSGNRPSPAGSAEAEPPYALTASFWFDLRQAPGRNLVSIRIIGRRVGATPPLTPKDRFVQDEVVEGIAANAGPVSLSMRIQGIASGEWAVDAYLLDPARRRDHKGKRRMEPERLQGSALSPAAWS